jgi:arginine N-succinyltransferase
MILLRGVRETDLDALIHLAQVPGMINLPGDRDTLRERIRRSVNSFQGTTPKEESKFTFVAEDLETGKILATSMIASQHGTAASPHFYFQVGNERRYSETINTGFIHGTLTLGYDTDGPSEIGALVVDSELRNNEVKIGRQISFVRFLYLAGHRERFRSKIIAELLPPLNKRGLSPLWEAIGRRFTSMDYWEADLLCANNKEFIFDLFPTGKIYTTFLPAEARNAIGKVGKDTEPVVHMLKKIGFEYKNQIDPFDGGPHLWADVEKLVPIRKSNSYHWNPKGLETDSPLTQGIITSKSANAEFRAIAVDVQTTGDEITVKNISQKQIQKLEELLEIKSGDSVLFMPYY